MIDWVIISVDYFRDLSVWYTHMCPFLLNIHSDANSLLIILPLCRLEANDSLLVTESNPHTNEFSLDVFITQSGLSTVVGTALLQPATQNPQKSEATPRRPKQPLTGLCMLEPFGILLRWMQEWRTPSSEKTDPFPLPISTQETEMLWVRPHKARFNLSFCKGETNYPRDN